MFKDVHMHVHVPKCLLDVTEWSAQMHCFDCTWLTVCATAPIIPTLPPAVTKLQKAYSRMAAHACKTVLEELTTVDEADIPLD